MKKALIAIVLAGGCAPKPRPSTATYTFANSEPEVVWEENFDAAAPVGWASPSSTSDDVVAQVYRIAENGGQRYLSATHHGAGPGAPPAVHWGRPWRESPIPLSSSCTLSWRWRVIEHPRVGDDAWEDLAVSVYVVMAQPGLFASGKGFKFGWLEKPGPKGTKQRGLIQIALRTGGPTDTWQREQVDLCRLFAQHYGDPGEEKLMYIGVVSDADNTDSTAKGDYDDFVLSTAPMTKKRENVQP